MNRPEKNPVGAGKGSREAYELTRTGEVFAISISKGTGEGKDSLRCGQ